MFLVDSFWPLVIDYQEKGADPDIMEKQKFLIPISFMMLIFISSSIPMDKEIKGLEIVMKIDPGLQNVLHIPIFALLSYFWLRSFYYLKLFC